MPLQAEYPWFRTESANTESAEIYDALDLELAIWDHWAETGEWITREDVKQSLKDTNQSD